MNLRRYALMLVVVVAGCADQPQQGGAVGGSGGSTAGISTDGTDATDTTNKIEAGVQVKVLSHDEIEKLIASHKGKVVVMDCWSTSCEPCVKEFPRLVELHKQHGPEKVACISLSFDYEGLGKPEDVLPVVQEFVAKQGATFDNVLCLEDSETLYKKMTLASVPAVYVYKADGTLAKRFDNENAAKPEDAFNYEHVAQLVQQLVAESKP